MLPANLTTNEVKSFDGTEVEMTRISTGDRTTEFAGVNETYAFQNRLLIRHQEIGDGINMRRRSNISFSITTNGSIDTTKKTKTIASVTLDIPIGNTDSADYAKIVLSELISLLGSKGASTTILYDGSGYGAESLLKGSL